MNFSAGALFIRVPLVWQSQTEKNLLTMRCGYLPDFSAIFLFFYDIDISYELVSVFNTNYRFSSRFAYVIDIFGY